MTLKVFDDVDQLAQAAAEEILEIVKVKPNALLCLATGSSPIPTYRQLVYKGLREKIDFTKVHFIGLDEWVGIEPTNPGSCHYFLQQNLFKPLQIMEGQIHLFNAMADLTRECDVMDKKIIEWGGIDLMVAGMGMNGHVGFNEPGTPPDLYSHVIRLDSTTITVGQKYFEGQTVLNKGITLGMKHFFDSGAVLMIVAGNSKSTIVKRTVNDKASMELPATYIRKHKNGTLLIDTDAAAQLAT